jgi:hypothetical protein
MDNGLGLWAGQKLSLPQIQLISGHKTKTQILRYMKTSLEAVRALTSVRKCAQPARQDATASALPGSNVISFTYKMG